MTLPRLFVWLPRRSAIRQVLTPRPPHYYTHSQHVSGCGINAPTRHITKLVFMRSDQFMEYELTETFINGAANNTSGRITAWNDKNDLVEEQVNVSPDSATYVLQLNSELLVDQSSNHASNIYPKWPTTVVNLFAPHITPPPEK